MAIVVGALTTAYIGPGNVCVVSANWGYNPNAQRLYCLGSWSASQLFYRPTETLNITCYSPGPIYSTLPPQPGSDCTDADTIQAGVSPGTCSDSGESFSELDGEWWVTSYSYSKDSGPSPGQESWSLTKWKDLSTQTPAGSIEPDYVMRGIAEGQTSGGTGGSVTGIVIADPAVQTQTGSVSAGGFGRADVMSVGVVTSVGNGSSSSEHTGQGSASIPYTPLYL